jgi:hypothetical protein
MGAITGVDIQAISADDPIAGGKVAATGTILIGDGVDTWYKFGVWAGGTITDPIGAPDGTTAAPAYSFSSDTDTGLYSFGANAIGFSCGNASVGNWSGSTFTIGTNVAISSTKTLTLAQTSDTTVPLTISTNALDCTMALTTSNTAASTSSIVGLTMNNSGGKQGSLTVLGANYPTTGVFTADQLAIQCWNSAGMQIVARDASGFIGFTTGGFSNERMRIDSAGRVGIGAAATTQKLEVAGAILSDGAMSGNPTNATMIYYESNIGHAITKGTSTNLKAFREEHLTWDVYTGANTGAMASRLAVTDAKTQVKFELEVDGDFNHDGSNFGAFGVSPVARRSAFTQTYASATRTHNNQTQGNTTALATSGGWGASSSGEFDSIITNLNNARADIINLKQVVNSLIDDQQALGFAQ